jgi:hypothetical protein
MRRARHKRRRGAQHGVRGMRTIGVAALLPALFLAALYVAAPFAGTTTHAISRVSPAVAQPVVLPADGTNRHVNLRNAR